MCVETTEHFFDEVLVKNDKQIGLFCIYIWYNIPTEPNEMELVISEANRNYLKAEERLELLAEVQTPQKLYKPKVKEDNSDQISLF